MWKVQMDMQTWIKPNAPNTPSHYQAEVGGIKKYCTSKYQTYKICPLTSGPFLNYYDLKGY